MGLPQFESYPLPTLEEIPRPRGPWKPETHRIALLVHDMQQYFLRPYQADAAPLAPAIANMARLLAHARQHQIPVFYTAQTGNQLRSDRGLQADLWGPGMQAISEHEQIVAALAPRENEQVLRKHRYSAFQRSPFEEMLREAQRDQLLITGVYAHIGCLATAVEAFQRDIEAFIAADAVADYCRADHDLALRWIADCCGVPLATASILESVT